MYIGELKKILRKLPNTMKIVLEMEDGELITMCHQSGVDVIKVVKAEGLTEEQLEEAEGEDTPVFIIKPCTCNPYLPELGEINSQPELN